MKRQSICPKTQFVFWSTPNENTSSVITQTWMKASLLMDLLYVINGVHLEKNAAITNTSSGFDFGYKTFLCVLLKIVQDQKLNRLSNRVLVTLLLWSALLLCRYKWFNTHYATVTIWCYKLCGVTTYHIWATNFLTLQGCLYFIRRERCTHLNNFGKGRNLIICFAYNGHKHAVIVRWPTPN